MLLAATDRPVRSRASGFQEMGLPFESDVGIPRHLSAFLQAHAGEASMMARCTGKTNLHNLEPEDLRTVTLSAASATGIPLVGTRA